MSILGTITMCISRIPQELIEKKVIYAEVDRESYEKLDSDFSLIVNDTNYVALEEKVADIGKCKTFKYADYTIVITQDKRKAKQEDFYIAFKTKII